MKKYVLIMAIALALVFSANAAENVSFNLSATVGAALNITTTIPGTKTVDPTTTATALGAVSISSNLTNWTITVSSLRLGNLRRTGGTELYPYLFSFGTLSSDYNLATNLVLTRTAPQSATSYNLAISHQTASALSLPAGAYEDTITITLAAI